MNRLRHAINLLFILALVVFVGYVIKDKFSEKSWAPIITAKEELIVVSVEDDESVLLEGLKAEDREDGNLTEDIRVVSMSHFINDSKRKVKYVVFDSSNQAAIYEREVQYTDYTSPKIYISKPLRCSLTQIDKIDLLEGVTAEDCIDGDLTNQVRMISDTLYYGVQGGKQFITFQVSNKAGDVCAIEVEYTITDSMDMDERLRYYPVLSEYVVYTKVGKKVELRKYIKGLEQNGTEYLYKDDEELEERTENEIKISGDVDYSEPGVYTVEYSYKSDSGVKAVTKLYVVVEER